MVASPQPGNFHPLIQRWFAARVGAPTEVQRLAWARIAAGEHVLVTAPTGSGKTLAAFLWAIDRLATGAWEPGTVRVLYVSPLRALNNDIQRNLTWPREQLARVFGEAGEPYVPIRTATRSADTPASERRQMLRRPPEILITTPESLNILLTSASGQRLLSHVRTVILDEVHAVAGSKRGTHLITAVERLARMAGEFQRIALSATVRPLERVAAWVGGYERIASDEAAFGLLAQDKGTEARYRARPVAIVDAGGHKAYDLTVCHRKVDELPRPEWHDGHPIWNTLAAEIARELPASGATLIFANSRRVVERLARLINTHLGEPRVYAHHGSLSRELREVVEERMKAGELAAIVATSSLELGIDVGAIDRVILVGTPPSIAATVQRLGRAGHQVGETSRGRLYATYALDILNGAVVARGVLEGEIEPLHPPSAPLDVLAQVVLSMTAVEAWRLDDLYDAIRAAEPYRHLPRRLFNLVIEMLAGRYADARVSELRPRISIDRASGTAWARPGAALLVYGAGGTIPDRGYFRLRLADSRAVVGELDEEFVWERRIGDSFTMGAQTWRIERVTQDDVLVRPGPPGAAMTPFWRYERPGTGFWLAERRLRLLEAIHARLGEPTLPAELARTHALEEDAARELVRVLSEQKAATGCELPHRHHVVVEHVRLLAGIGVGVRPAADPAAGERRLTVVHTLWGSRLNRPWALALSAALEARLGRHVDVAVEEDCIAIEAPEPVPAAELLRLVPAGEVEDLLRRKLAQTGFFGARFRENAGRALLLERGGFGRRTPLWLSRRRAKELTDAVASRADFPITLETWRTCLQDEFDLEALRGMLAEIAAGTLAVSEVTTASPSPFAAEVVYQRTNALMYADDAPEGGVAAARPDLIEEIARSGELRPRVPAALIATLRAKLQRTHPGYAPREAGELIEWVKERVFLLAEEWEELLAAMARDHGAECAPGFERAALLAQVAHRVVALTAPAGEGSACGEPDARPPALIAHVERVDFLRRALPWGDGARLLSAALDGAAAAREALAAAELLCGEPSALNEVDQVDKLESLLGEWLHCQGPWEVEALGAALRLPTASIESALSSLADRGQIVLDHIGEDAEAVQVCDSGNLARLLRALRAGRRVAGEPHPAADLPLFLAARHGLGSPRRAEDLPGVMERLFGYPAQAALWEEEILPARMGDYRPGWLDGLLAESDLVWVGCGPQRMTFALLGEIELVGGGAVADAPSAGQNDTDEFLERILPPGSGRFTFEKLLSHTGGGDSAALARALWDLAWLGCVTNTTMAALRQGLASAFRTDGPPRLPRPARFDRWRASRPFGGAWMRLPRPDPPADALAREELNRERARILLDRYGLLFRELLARELPALQWPALVRTLRIMELSGEIIGGSFFAGIPGLQFIAPEALAQLQSGLPEDRIYWINAADPISPCGLELPGWNYPRRTSSTHLVFDGPALMIISQRRGRQLEVRVAPEHPRLAAYFGFLEHLLARAVRPRRGVVIEEINGRPAAESGYRAVLAQRFEVARDHRALRVGRRY